MAENRTLDAVRLLSVLLGQTDLPREDRVAALRMRARGWRLLGSDRRAWRDIELVASLEGEGDVWVVLQRALLLDAHGRGSATYSEVEPLVAAYPEVIEGWQLLGRLATGESRIGCELRHARSLAIATRSVEYVCRLAGHLLDLGDVEQADAVLGWCSDQSAAPLESVRARICFERRDASGLARALAGYRPDGVQEGLWVANAWLLLGDPAQAVRALESVRPAHRHQSESEWVVAAVGLHCRVGDMDAAARLVSDSGYSPARAVLLAARGEWRAVIEETDGHASLGPAVRHLRAEALRRCGQTTEALNEFVALMDNPCTGGPALILNRLMIEPMPELLAASLDAFSPMFLTLPPDGGAFHERLAWIRARGDDLLDRLGAARDALLVWRGQDGTIRSSYPSPSVRSSLARLRQAIVACGLETVVECHKGFLDREPQNPLVYTYRAEVRMWSGQFMEARLDLERAIELDPSIRWASIGLALLDVLEGRAERALDRVEEAQKRLGPLSAAAPIVGEAMLRLGSCHDAERVVLEGLARRPDRVSSWLLLGLARLRTGRSSSSIERAVEDVWPELCKPWAHLPIEQRFEAMLAAMLGNRSSGLVTWRDPDGGWRGGSARTMPRRLLDELAD